ncbi:hypothetical protein [Oceanospirillum beijerinckii]|uniref:hypothetical protein n=1 Tax=Oceanospirillum beijerinckii TaxID=64976 RepID=UPI0012FEEBC4|nr:hypothetical protein [Oceanospirillum beijerinckii]
MEFFPHNKSHNDRAEYTLPVTIRGSSDRTCDESVSREGVQSWVTEAGNTMLKKMMCLLFVGLFSVQAQAVDGAAVKEKAEALLDESAEVVSEAASEVGASVSEAAGQLGEKASEAMGGVGDDLKQLGSKLWSAGKDAAEVAKDELQNAKEYLEKKAEEREQQSEEQQKQQEKASSNTVAI